MKFTDEQVMQYVDGEAGVELKTKIMKALEKKDKELEEQVFRFQLANTVMLKHSKEKKEMPELFYAKLRRKRLEKEGSLAKSSISAYSFKNFGRLAFAASIAAFGLLFAYQSQQTNNENLAREFYSSFKAENRSDDFLETIKLANVNDFIEKSTKMKGVVKGTGKPRTLSNKIDGDLDITVYLQKGFSYRLENGDFAVIGSELGIDLQGLNSGLVTLIYQDSTGEKQVLLDRKPIKKGERKSLGMYEIVGPKGLDYIQYIYSSDDGSTEVQSDIIKFTILENGANFMGDAAKEFMSVPASLFSRTVEVQLGDKIIDESVLSFAEDVPDSNEEIKKADTSIWQKDGKFYIDVNDNGYANIISYQNSDNDGWNISIDRNSNRVIDGFGLVSVDQNGKYSFRWLLDENEDGVVDRVAIDNNGDWQTDKAYPLYPKGSSFSF
jgi:hypothetical protein